MKGRWFMLMYLIYCVEAGLFLILVPWSLLWAHGYFAQVPGLRPVVLSGYVRGAVSAVGALILGVGAKDLLAFCRTLRES